jgi:hypothetical protein
MGRIYYRRSILVILLAFYGMIIFSQENKPLQGSYSNNGAVKVFIDCNRCDMNYTRQNIPYVNYVRDVKEAEVYILVTDQRSGSGGNQFTFKFQGHGRFSDLNDTLISTTSPDQTNTAIRQKLTNMLKMGLMRYVAKTPMADEIEISYSDAIVAEEVEDNWNFWVFGLQTSPRYTMEETYRRLEISNSVEISRITPDLKFEIDFRQNFNRQRFIEDESDTTYLRNSEFLNNLIVMSISDHWSAGMRWQIGKSTWENYDLNFDLMPALEYNLYPYSEATHHQLRFQYSAGVQFSNYSDTTLFNKTKEILSLQTLRIAYEIQEKWGSINISLRGSNFLHNFAHNRIELDGYLRIRLFKGLSVSLNGGAGYINDRINLAKGELSEAERLLRLKQQATKYEIRGGISLTYIFGSIFNNVVNPRFSGGG